MAYMDNKAAGKVADAFTTTFRGNRQGSNQVTVTDMPERVGPVPASYAEAVVTSNAKGTTKLRAARQVQTAKGPRFLGAVENPDGVVSRPATVKAGGQK